MWADRSHWQSPLARTTMTAWILFCAQSAASILRSISRNRDHEKTTGAILSPRFASTKTASLPTRCKDSPTSPTLKCSFICTGKRRFCRRRAPAPAQQSKLASGRNLRPTRKSTAESNCRDRLSVDLGSRADSESARPGRFRRFASVGHQTGLRRVHSRPFGNPAAQMVS
jgi:hypothetical protein